MLKQDRDTLIIQFYKQGKSSLEIAEEANWGISVRQIQRIIKEASITRTQSEAFRKAIEKGRMVYKKKL